MNKDVSLYPHSGITKIMNEQAPFIDKKIAYYTLGCKLNFAETSTIGKQLTSLGFRKVKNGELADICLINTCSVTEVANRKGRQAIHRLRKQYPDALIVVTGCYAQLKPDEVAAVAGVDWVLGMNEKFSLPALIEQLERKTGETGIQHSVIRKIETYHPACSADDRTRHFLKVQDGCDYFCTYCTIPYARGKSRNGTIESIVADARRAVADGAREIVLSGVNIGDFGKTTGETLLDLIKALDSIESDCLRYRISSIEPNLLTDDIIDYTAQSRHFAPHFHIPLQSGSDDMLRLMKRRYDTALFAHKIRYIKQCMPYAFIGIDVIVGARGETPKLFEETYRFIQGLDISQLHVFSYSERENTKMLEIPYIVSPKEKKRRSDLLHALSADKLQAFYHKYVGIAATVLWESKKKGGLMNGFTENYIKLYAPYDSSKVNCFERVVLTLENISFSAD